jgi:hypothetical protein
VYDDVSIPTSNPMACKPNGLYAGKVVQVPKVVKRDGLGGYERRQIQQIRTRLLRLRQIEARSARWSTIVCSKIWEAVALASRGNASVESSPGEPVPVFQARGHGEVRNGS